MIQDEQELDFEIRNALRTVDVPVGAKENLLLQLVADAERAGDRNETDLSTVVTQEAITADRELSACDSHCSVTLNNPVPLNASSRETNYRRWKNSWLLVASAAILACVLLTLWPSGTGPRLDVLLARHIERIENEPIKWQPAKQLPASIQRIMNQVVQLQPLGFADITPAGSLSHIHVYSFRNQEGKQVLVVDMSKPAVRQKFGSQLTPLNTNTGGWSCAAAEVQGNLIVFAVPGNRAYLLEHLRSITVT